MVASNRLAALAVAATLAAQPALASAQAQQACITEAEASATAIYAMPSLIQAVRMRCSSSVSADGFLASQSQRLSARYAAMQNQVWPRAKSGMLKFLGSQAQGAGDLGQLANLPDSAVRPLVDALIVQELSPEIKVQDCGAIERALSAVAPIDPEVAGTLLGVLAGLAGFKELSVCPVTRP